MSTPAIIMLVLLGLNLLMAANRHGKPQEAENFWHSLISAAIMVSLLIWGGFFN